MQDDHENRCYVEHMISEHRRLHSLLQEMRDTIAHSVIPDKDLSFVEFERILVRLHEELKHHFAQEESGGCLDEAVSFCPRLAPEAKRIEAEHPELLAKVGRLLNKAQTLPPTHQNQIAIQLAFDQLCQRLRTHEKAENALLAQGFGVSVNGDESDHPAPIVDV